jgi:cell division protein FtsA
MVFDDLFVSLDVGSSKVLVTVCGEVAGDDRLHVLASASVPSDGLHRGVVIDLKRTATSIRRAVEAAEAQAGVEIDSATVGVANSNIRSMNSEGVVAVRGSGITAADVRRCIEAAKTQAIPADRQVIHSLPQSYTVDSHDGVRQPIGMAGRRLAARVHVVTASVNNIKNTVQSVKAAGYEVEDIVLEPLASAFSVLHPDEKDLGVCVVDLGCGTTDLAIYCDGELKHTQVLEMGGEQLSRELSRELLTPIGDAERIKCEWGVALAHKVEEGDWVEVPSVGGRASRKLERRRIAEFIEERMGILFEKVLHALQGSGYADRLGGGVVITGGGANLRGIAELGERVLHMPVRRGLPHGLAGNFTIGPESAVGIGLCQYARDHADDIGMLHRRHRHVDGETTGFFKISKRLMEVFSGPSQG